MIVLLIFLVNKPLTFPSGNIAYLLAIGDYIRSVTRYRTGSGSDRNQQHILSIAIVLLVKVQAHSKLQISNFRSRNFEFQNSNCGFCLASARDCGQANLV
jgi:hypothetical protein